MVRDLEEVVERLEGCESVVGIVRYGGRRADDMSPGGDFDLFVLVKVLPDSPRPVSGREGGAGMAEGERAGSIRGGPALLRGARFGGEDRNQRAADGAGSGTDRGRVAEGRASRVRNQRRCDGSAEKRGGGFCGALWHGR